MCLRLKQNTKDVIYLQFVITATRVLSVETIYCICRCCTDCCQYVNITTMLDRERLTFKTDPVQVHFDE